MSDQFNQLHVTSDPFISTKSISFTKKEKRSLSLPEDALMITGVNEAANGSRDIDEESSDNDSDDED